LDQQDAVQRGAGLRKQPPVHAAGRGELTMRAMQVYWRDKQQIVTSADDLRSVVETVRQLDEPTMLFLEGEERETLVVGLGHDESVLTFVQSDGKSFHSLGDPSRTGRLRFWCRDQIDEFMEEMAVPEKDAVNATFQFLASGGKPSIIRWEADW
jgi:hypothetical protein